MGEISKRKDFNQGIKGKRGVDRKGDPLHTSPTEVLDGMAGSPVIPGPRAESWGCAWQLWEGSLL